MGVQLVTGKPPFSQMDATAAMPRQISGGLLPVAKNHDTSALPKKLWPLLQICWRNNPKERPDIAVVMTEMETLILNL